MEVGEIRNELRRLRLTQTALAAHLGIHKGDLSRLLAGKARMRLDTFRKIEAFLAQHRSGGPGVRETASTAYQHEAPERRAHTHDEKARAIRNLVEIGDAYKRLPRLTKMSDEELLGYDDSGLPT